MSISLALVPVALALRVVMGKQRFESWVDSLQTKVPTNLSENSEFLRTIRKAGYDAESWGGSYKTHIRGEEFFFFWEKIDGKWTAVFAKSDSKSDIKAFIRDVEQKSGKKVFLRDDEDNRIVTVPTKTFPTNFRDQTMLVKALVEYGLKVLESDSGKVIAEAGNCTLTFRQDTDGPFSVEVRNAPDVRQIYEHLSEINDGYCQNVQANTYQSLMSRVADRGFEVEQEDVLEDNSIVITLKVVQ